MIAFNLSFGLIVFSVAGKWIAFAGELPIESRATPYRNAYKWCIDYDDYDNTAVDDETTKLERCLAKLQQRANVPVEGELMKKKMLDGMRPILLKFFEEIEKKYDPSTAHQLLQNLIDAATRNRKFVAGTDNNAEYLPSSTKNQAYRDKYPSNKTDLGKNVLIGTSKRYLGALARSGWLPRNFNLRSSAGASQPAAFDRVRLLRAMDVRKTPAYYYRGGRGPASFRSPRLYSPSNEPVGVENRRCSCKRNVPV